MGDECMTGVQASIERAAYEIHIDRRRPDGW